MVGLNGVAAGKGRMVLSQKPKPGLVEPVEFRVNEPSSRLP